MIDTIEQRTDEWREQRRGKFTASQVHRLLGKITHKTTQKSIENYALESAIDQVFGLEPELEFLPEDMRRGVELEPMAFEKFSELMAMQFIEVEDCGFFPYGRYSGASPDGLVSSDAVLEIKCPKRKKFFELVMYGEDAIDEKYKDQMTLQMMATKRKRAYFFNYVVDRGVEYWHCIEYKLDNARATLIDERLTMAGKRKSEIIKDLTNKKQF